MTRPQGRPALNRADIAQRWKSLTTDDLQEIYWPTAKAEADLLPLVLFKGRTSLGYVQSLWNFTQAIKAAGVESLADAGRYAPAFPDVVHSTGLHLAPTDLRLDGSSGLGDKLWRLSNRIYSSPSVQRADPELFDYLRSLVVASRRMMLHLSPIDRYSPWSKQAWRRPIKGPDVPIPMAWPFLPEAAPVERMDGADLLLAVDAAIPRTLPKQVRDDVCQDVVLAVLEGEITVNELQDRSQQFIKAVFKRFPIKYGHISLDSPPPWDPSGRTLAETLVAS